LSDISDKELTIVVRFEAFMVVKIQVEVFWVVTLCSAVVVYQVMYTWFWTSLTVSPLDPSTPRLLWDQPNINSF
jgi:hypothetical protein